MFFFFIKKFLISINKYLKIKFCSRNMFGSIGHTVVELDYFFQLLHKYKIYKFKFIFLSNKNRMAKEAYKLFSNYFFASIISDKIDYIIKKFILKPSNNLGIDFGLSSIRLGHEKGNYPLDFVFKKYINYFKLRRDNKNFNPFKEISFSKQLKFFLNEVIGDSKYIVIQIKQQKGNSTILKTDPKTYLKSIKFYQEKKYKIIFAGRSEIIPKEFEDIGVVDYSQFKHASFQTDLNLISASDLVISGASGFANIAQVYDIPCVYANSWHIVLTPSSKYCVHLPYKFLKRETGLLSNYDEIIKLYLNKYNQDFHGEDIYEVICNTEDEILQASIEALNLKKNYFEPHQVYLKFKDKYKGLPIRYCDTRISTHFINNYEELF